MKHQMRILQGLKLAAVLAVALSMGACANKNLGADGAMASAATPGSQQDFVVNVGDRVFFESDQTDLTPQAIATLEKQAQWLQSYNRYSFTIEGHADERGPEDFNRKLSEDRARSVLEFMVKQGVARERLSSVGFGASKPLVSKSNEYSWLLNRRVEFTVTRQMRQGGSATTATGTTIPSQNSLPPAPPAGPADVAPPPEATPPRKPGDNEPESATPPPEAGHPDSAPKKAGAK